MKELLSLNAQKILIELFPVGALRKSALLAKLLILPEDLEIVIDELKSKDLVSCGPMDAVGVKQAVILNSKGRVLMGILR